MDTAVEQEFLSGIEPLSSNSETSTPHGSKLKNGLFATDSLNSTEDPANFPRGTPGFSPSPVKSHNQSSSMIEPEPSSNSFTNAAQEITKRLQDSLTSSLKREKEVEAALSPALRRKDSASFSSPSCMPNSSPQKITSPSKYRVRFDDDIGITDPHDSGWVPKMSPLDFTTPTKAQSPLRIPVSPTKRDSEISTNYTTGTPSNSIDLSFLTSTQLPQNEEEKQKLFEFIKRMKTSLSGDPLSSLDFLGSSQSNGRLPGLSAKMETAEANIKPDSDSKPINKKSGFQIARKKPDAKKENPVRLKGSKNTKEKNISKEQTKKYGVAKKTMQKNGGLRQPKHQAKPVQGSKKDKPMITDVNHIEVPDQYTAEGRETIDRMESVRNHLQGMLRMNPDGKDSKSPSKEEILARLNAKHEDDGPESFRSNDTATLLSVQPSEFLPLTSSLDLSAGDVGAMINSATSSIFTILRGQSSQHHQPTSARSPIDPSLTAENNILKDALDKERYRRNHCEKQIQKLQNKLLEIQQQLAVGQSVTRKKDMMIEQLDKTLAKVVEGWKFHEQNLATSVRQLTAEKEKNKSDTSKHREMIGSLQTDFTKTLNDLSDVQEKLQLKEEEQKMLQQTFQLKTHEISRVIDQKNQTIEQLLNDKQGMVQEMKDLSKQMEEQQMKTEFEKEKYQDKEEEWKEEMLEQQNKMNEEIKQNKIKLQHEKSRYSELEKVLASTQQEVKRLEDLMESLRQGLDSLNMQNSVDEAKYSATIRKMEAEHLIDIEKKVTEKLTKIQEEAELKEKEIRDNHHQQIMEVTASNQVELENQCRRYENRIEQLEKRAKSDIEEKEKRFAEILKDKTENMRRQMMNKMQNLLQAHYNETLELVGSTTGNTPMRPTRTRTISSMLYDMKNSSFMMTGPRQQDTMGLNESTMLFQDSLRETNSNMKLSHASENTLGQLSKQVFSEDSNYIRQPTNVTQSSIAIPQTTGAHTISKEYSSNQQSEKVSLFPSDLTLGIKETYNLKPEDKSIATNESIQQTIGPGSCTGIAHHPYSVGNVLRTPMMRNSYVTEIALPEDSMSSDLFTQSQIPISGEEGSIQERQQQLQHYIKMLLDKSPGEPLEVPVPTSVSIQDRMQPLPPPSIASLSPIVVRNELKVAQDENKENIDAQMKLQSHVPSEIAMGVMNFLNQQLKTQQPSPDLIPLQKTKLPNSSLQSTKNLTKPQQRKPPQKSSAFQQYKVNGGSKNQIQNSIGNSQKHVDFCASPTKVETETHAKLYLKDLDGNKTAADYQLQFGEVSKMLGSYMTGDTQEAAEKLLSYLAESQSKNAQETSLDSSRFSQKTRNKIKTPSKSNLPAWR